MSDLATAPPKKPGTCIRCGTAEVYEVLVRDEDGTPKRLGPMNENGCQLEFLLSDGSEADIACCLDCARTITPADYLPIWRAVVDRTAAILARRPGNDARVTLARYIRLWPIALKLCRREDQDTGGLMVDRRMLDG